MEGLNKDNLKSYELLLEESQHRVQSLEEENNDLKSLLTNLKQQASEKDYLLNELNSTKSQLQKLR